MGSSNVMWNFNQPLTFDTRLVQTLGVLSQTLVTLSGNIVLVNFMVIEDPLDFNMILGCDYVYAMQVVVSMLLHVMYFNHGEEMVTIDQLYFLDPSPDPIRD